MIPKSLAKRRGHRRADDGNFAEVPVHAEGRYQIKGLGDGQPHAGAVHRGFVSTRLPVHFDKPSNYGCDQAVFPTASTFVIQGMMPGHTIIGVSPNKQKQKVVKILYGGRDVLTS
jgi:hypothetical protein